MVAHVGGQQRRRHLASGIVWCILVVFSCTRIKLVQCYVPHNIRHGTTTSTRFFAVRGTSIIEQEGYQVTQIHAWNGFNTSSIEWRGRPKPTSSASPSNVSLPTSLVLLDPATFPTLSRARKAIRNNLVLVKSNSTLDVGKTDTRVYPGDWVVQRTRNSSTYPNLTYAKPTGLDLPVVYQDDELAIVNKPCRMLSHSTSKAGYGKNSVLRILPHILTAPKSRDALTLPVAVHRLDFATSGVLVIAKTKSAAQSLSQQFEMRKVAKTYYSLLNGIPSCLEGEVDYDIDGKRAVTSWKTIAKYPCMQAQNATVTLVEFRPLHGRKHQLRRHAAEVLQCPIVGDELYTNARNSFRNANAGKIMLCATCIELRLPSSGETVVFRIDLPSRFERFLKQQEKKWNSYCNWMRSKGIQCLLDMYEVSKDYA